MASVIAKKPCAKCSKGIGVATCDGCQQSFCIKHFGEHRQELSHQMDSVGQEHDLLQRDLNQQNIEHPFISRINTWERESMTKIQVAAQAARDDLQKLLDINKKELKKSVNEITDELQSFRESDGYTEVDINKWIQQLQVLRKTLESPSTIHIAEDESPQSIIRSIRIHDQQQHRTSSSDMESLEHRLSVIEKSSSFNDERFDQIVGEVTLSEQSLMATCYSSNWFSDSIVYGANRYSSEKHHIRFRIGKVGRTSMFFGICTSSEKNSGTVVRDESRHGWWNLSEVVANGKFRNTGIKRVTMAGDEVTLILNCDKRQIQLQHHRTNLQVELCVDLDKCLFPWKIVVQLTAKGDCVRILQ
jgi:hypothetical protein